MNPPPDTPPGCDVFTGLANRRVFEGGLVAAVERARVANLPVAVLAADLDNMKRVNQWHRFSGGDQAIFRFAHLFGSLAVEAACIARTGGDDFALFVPGVRSDELLGFAQWLRSAVKAECAEYGLTVSIGLADTRHGATAGAVHEAAREAVREAKQEGRDRVVQAGG